MWSRPSCEVVSWKVTIGLMSMTEKKLPFQVAQEPGLTKDS